MYTQSKIHIDWHKQDTIPYPYNESYKLTTYPHFYRNVWNFVDRNTRLLLQLRMELETETHHSKITPTEAYINVIATLV